MAIDLMSQGCGKGKNYLRHLRWRGTADFGRVKFLVRRKQLRRTRTPHQKLTSHKNPANGWRNSRRSTWIGQNHSSPRRRAAQVQKDKLIPHLRGHQALDDRHASVHSSTAVSFFQQPRYITTLHHDCCSQTFLHLKPIDSLPTQDSIRERNPSLTLAQLGHSSTSHFREPFSSVADP